MLDRKELIQELCNDLQKRLNTGLKDGEQPRKVDFFIGLKPENYWLPACHFGSIKTVPNRVRMAWFIEIFVDGICIFRDTYIQASIDEDCGIIEGLLTTRMLREIFCFGVMASKKVIDEYRT